MQTSLQANYSIQHLHAFLNLWTLLRTSARWTTIHPPDARTSHLRTLSKIVGTGLSALFRPRHRSARGSRTLYSSFRERQHLSANFLLLPDPPKSLRFRSIPSYRAAHLTACFRLVNPGRNRRFPRPRQPSNRSAGRASYRIVSSRQHLPKPLLLQRPRQPINRSAGPRIMQI